MNQDDITGLHKKEKDYTPVTYPRLEDQIEWYEGKSQKAHRIYKSVAFFKLLLAVLVPVVVYWSSFLTVFFGVLIVILHSLESLNQWHQTWIVYHSTCEYLKVEKFLFLKCAGPYRELGSGQSRILLAERVERIISTEHTY